MHTFTTGIGKTRMPYIKTLCIRRVKLAKFICPSCSTQKSKPEIEGLKSLYGLGFEYVCSNCNSKVVHPPIGQLILLFAFIPIIVVNWPGSSWAFEQPFIAMGLFMLSAILMKLGLKKMKPYVVESNA
ncbi:hypothetical protein EKG38_24560 [Shewanella canadensis]|uniref:Uncharacterized protein n=1 Tax=Shewanella canadensis TaxID=271096 RepID=A0A3S0IJZ5_9GAMM|nr:hypothetical protein [Shewanella canadensis]RTR35888.1 hypothetical protein EKG38_24560 [Shewanella canadensis]